MKTGTQWINQLPEPVRSQVYENIGHKLANLKYSSLGGTLHFVFEWKHSKEGWTYWRTIYKLANAKAFDGHTPEYVLTFISYIQDNVQVWQAFRNKALAIARKREYYGAKAIMEVVRYESIVSERGEFKVNNNITACFARVFVLMYPQHKDFFRLRKSKYDL